MTEYTQNRRDRRDWKAFGNEVGQVKQELMPALDDVQHGLCAYCEIELAHANG